MSSNIWLKNGIYDPSKRFAFTNITDEDFTFRWADNPIKVKAGETVELPHHLAVIATTQLVDKIMIGEVHEEELKVRSETRNPSYRSPRGISLGVPAAREPYEKKILKELEPRSGTDSQFQIIRAQKAEEILRDLRAENSSTPPVLPASSLKDFEDVNLPVKN